MNQYWGLGEEFTHKLKRKDFVADRFFIPSILDLIIQQYFQFLSPKTALSIAVVSKSCWDRISPLISAKYKFIYLRRQYNKYKPKYLTRVPNEGRIQNYVTQIVYDNYFNGTADYLHPSLTHITFGKSFNNYVDLLPPSLTHLTFGDNFNKPIDFLPKYLTHLTFGNSFNNYVDKLPPYLTHLTFGFQFNKPVNKLPKKLTHLTCGYSFNQPVNQLPLSLTHIYLRCNYSKPTDFLSGWVTLTFLV